MIRDPSDGSVKKPLNGYERLKAKYGENWGLNLDGPEAPRPKFKAPTIEQLAEHYARHDLEYRAKQAAARKPQEEGEK